MFSLFATPLGFLMKGCYKLVGNYAIALLIFTIITRLIMLPLSIKQQKSTARMSLIQPELEKLKKKYGKNQEKLNEETMALYQKHGVNPMASCLPLLITMLILFSMLPVIYGPMTYVSDLDKDLVNESNTAISALATVSTDLKNNDTTMEELLKNNDNDWDKVKKVIVNEDDKNYKASYKLFNDSDSKWNKIKEIFTKHPDIDKFITNDKYVSQSLVISRPELTTFDFVDKKKIDEYGTDFSDILDPKVKEYAENFNYEIFGLSLGAIPTFKSLLLLIPLISFLLQIAVTLVSNYYNKKNNPNAKVGKGMKVMLLLMPLFSLYISFSFPAGLGLYWIYSSIIALIQTIFLNKIYNPQHIRELVEADMEKNKERRKSGKMTFMERAIEYQNEQKGGKKPVFSDDDDDSEEQEGEESLKKLSKAEIKDLNRKKLNDARKRMAEKYGDEYVEDDN